ncbi:MAG: hypothetical protein DME97_15000 [Verrucomicrobia bacterium]|nr:MAG: hypothetical protein DME97_15000 [Verrucomicrobiota bacterium]
MVYFDTNYILKCYLNEENSADVLALAQGFPAGEIACCRHGRAEWHTGIHRAIYKNLLSPADAALLYAQMNQDEQNGLWNWLPIDDALVDIVCAEMLIFDHGLNLSGMDAIHLACARHHGITDVYTHDDEMLVAAPHFALVGHDVL